MAQRTVEIPEIGTVTLIKRRGNTNIRLSFARDGSIRVSLPYWVPYQSGVSFALQRKDWIDEHRPDKPALLHSRARIGKAHRLAIEQRIESQGVRVTVRQNVINVLCPVDTPVTHASVQKAAERGAHKALKVEADRLLPQRLEQLARQHHFTYHSVTTKRLSSRWGSCSQLKEIVLNIYLMQLPWELIDYVILHELTHTEHLNHSAQFWQRLEQALPNARALRKQIRQHRTNVVALD